MNVITANTLKPKRVESFDIARGICILLMVMGHAGFGMEFHKIIHTFHMPIFFFISGFFYRPEKMYSASRYLAHISRTLLLPYLIFCLFYEILHILYTGEFSLWTFLIEIVSSNHNRIDVAGSLWFLLCLFSAKFLYFIVDRLSDRLCMGMHGKTILIFVISLIANCFRKMDIMLPLCLDSALSCLLIFHVGYVLKKSKDTKQVQTLLSMPWMLFLSFVFLFVITAYFNVDINVRRNRFGIIPLYWISCFCGMFIILNISEWIDKGTYKFNRITKNIFGYWGRESIIFLIFNELMLFCAGVLLRLIGMPDNIIAGDYSIHMVMVIIAMILLSASAYFANRKPLRYLFGKR